MTQLYRVLYCSRNLVPGGPPAIAAEMRSILDVSRRNNQRAGVTGGLLFSAGCFAQVLEGSPEAVEEAFERIQCDERHSDVTVLNAGPIDRRDFPDWSMAFSGTQQTVGAPLGSHVLGDAPANTRAGRDVLDVLRTVIVRETEWLPPVAERMSAR